MNRISNIFLLFLILLSTQGKSQFFEYNNRLINSKLALQNPNKRGAIGLDLTTNSNSIKDNSFECAFNFRFFKDKSNKNQFSVTSNFRNYTNKAFYDPLLVNKTDKAYDGYFASLGLIY